MLVLRGEGVFARQRVEELLFNQFRRQHVRENDVVIDPAQVVLASAEFVQPQLDDW